MTNQNINNKERKRDVDYFKTKKCFYCDKKSQAMTCCLFLCQRCFKLKLKGLDDFQIINEIKKDEKNKRRIVRRQELK